MGHLRQFHLDCIARLDRSIRNDDRHDARLADDRTVGGTVKCGSHQALAKTVELGTRISQAGYFDNGLWTQAEASPSRERQQVDASSRDVFAHLTGTNVKATGQQLVEKLGVHQVHLAQVWLGRIARHTREVLDRATMVRVTLDTQAGQQANARLIGLTEAMRDARAYRHNDTRHVGRTVPASVPVQPLVHSPRGAFWRRK